MVPPPCRATSRRPTRHRRGGEPGGDEMKRRTLADVICPGPMRQNKDGHLKWRVRSPSSLGMFVAVSPHDHSAESVKICSEQLLGGQLVPVCGIVAKPAMQNRARFAHGVLRARARANIVAIHRHTDTCIHGHAASSDFLEGLFAILDRGCVGDVEFLGRHFDVEHAVFGDDAVLDMHFE